MKSFVKNYTGKAKKVNNLDIVQVTISLEKADEFIYDYEGKHYLKFEVAKRLNPDKFGNTHAVYVNQLVNDPKTVQAEEKPKSKKRGRPKKTA